MANPLRRWLNRSVRLRRFMRRRKDALVVALTRRAFAYIDRRSLDEALVLADRYGMWAYRLLGGPRRLAQEHLELAFGRSLPPSAREHLARASFQNAARSFVEMIKIDAIRARRETYIEFEGRHHFDDLKRAGKGAIVVTGHIGNWELLASACAWDGVSVMAIGRRVRNAALNDILVDFRRRQGVETILRESPNAAQQILRAIRSTSVLAMLIDQDTRVQSLSVPFFGRMARTPVAAASLAVRREIPVVVAFIQRRAQGGHRIVVHPPIEVRRGDDLAADIQTLTRRFSEEIEQQIRRNPAEWVWWHRRWRRAPQPNLDPDASIP